jgi:Ca2+-binding EF-hand superfamily protein
VFAAAVDTNGDGKLSRAEVEAVMRNSNLAVPRAHIDAVFDQINDSNGDGESNAPLLLSRHTR